MHCARLRHHGSCPSFQAGSLPSQGLRDISTFQAETASSFSIKPRGPLESEKKALKSCSLAACGACRPPRRRADLSPVHFPICTLVLSHNAHSGPPARMALVQRGEGQPNITFELTGPNVQNTGVTTRMVSKGLSPVPLGAGCALQERKRGRERRKDREGERDRAANSATHLAAPQRPARRLHVSL